MYMNVRHFIFWFCENVTHFLGTADPNDITNIIRNIIVLYLITCMEQLSLYLKAALNEKMTLYMIY